MQVVVQQVNINNYFIWLRIHFFKISHFTAILKSLLQLSPTVSGATLAPILLIIRLNETTVNQEGKHCRGIKREVSFKSTEGKLCFSVSFGT